MEGHAKKCVERYCELANKTTQQLYRVSTPCNDDHHFKEEEMKFVGELSQVCSQISLKCFYLARIGRPDILWSVNKLARSITKWTRACDKRLNRFISCIHHTCEYKHYCYVGNTATQCRLGLFEDSDFAGDLEDSKSTSGGTLCVFGSHTIVPISWMCKEPSVSHSSTESEIISLDAGLRLDGIPALELWDLIVLVLGNTIQTHDRTEQPFVNCDKDHGPNKRSQGLFNVLNNIDCVPSNVQFSRQEALLYVFEDNEAVIKMIMKGRSPTMRHVSRTHRVALDWLFDRINLDPKIQIKYIDTKNQLADILNNTRDEWNHLLCLFNISHFSSTVCSDTMAKRSQHDSGEERVTAKSRPMMNLIARAPSHVSSSTSVSRGKRSYGSQDPSSSVAKKEKRSGRPDIGLDQLKASDHFYHEQFVESFSSASYSKWDDDRAWSSQEWKTDIETYERSGRPDKISWRMIRKVRPGFSHDEIRLAGTAQSVRNEETPRDRSGRPDIDPQEGTWPQQFVIGNDEAELELSVESRSFVNRVTDQVRKRQKRISNVTENGEKTFYDLENVHGCNNGISSMHEKELPKQLSIHCKHDRSHTQTNVRHNYEIGV